MLEAHAYGEPCPFPDAPLIYALPTAHSLMPLALALASESDAAGPWQGNPVLNGSFPSNDPLDGERPIPQVHWQECGDVVIGS